jgi:hypothetical protein
VFSHVDTLLSKIGFKQIDVSTTNAKIEQKRFIWMFTDETTFFKGERPIFS